MRMTKEREQVILDIAEYFESGLPLDPNEVLGDSDETIGERVAWAASVQPMEVF